MSAVNQSKTDWKETRTQAREAFEANSFKTGAKIAAGCAVLAFLAIFVMYAGNVHGPGQLWNLSSTTLHDYTVLFATAGVGAGSLALITSTAVGALGKPYVLTKESINQQIEDLQNPDYYRQEIDIDRLIELRFLPPEAKEVVLRLQANVQKQDEYEGKEIGAYTDDALASNIQADLAQIKKMLASPISTPLSTLYSD